MSISKSQIERILEETRVTKELVEKAPETAKQAAALEYCDTTIALWEVALEGLTTGKAETEDKKDAKKSTIVPVKKKAAPKKKEDQKKSPSSKTPQPMKREKMRTGSTDATC